MTHCPSCGEEITGAGRFCPGCGAPVRSSSQIPTEMAKGPPARKRRPDREAGPARGSAGSRSAPPSSDGVSSGRFAPGAMLAGRYRIVGLLGKGGMGEVYRADDLTLGQAVALKFLPEEPAGDRERMSQLLEEVRIARQISHPNVCRVYDIEESDGQRFIAMEYVDGEDLASLLGRIGRFSGERGAQIARQICAGLAAAHDRGVLHRDLKPGNIMIDGRGKVRITDFGLAALSDDTDGLEIRAGTPAYMAPEQLEGREVTVRSDIYALGLVLYEIFTGKVAHRVRSREEALEAISSEPVSSPSSHVEELDRAVERVILRCLERDPRQRPSGALAVAAALPGGDPLAAALAAGETPSPEMVAAAGEEGTLRPPTAWLLMGAVLASLVLNHFILLERSLVAWVPLPRPPEVLADRAREVLGSLGHDLAVEDRAWGWEQDETYLDWMGDKGTPDRWVALRSGRPAAMRFWYRQSPVQFDHTEEWYVSPEDPPLTEPGMARVVLDPEGRLLSLDVVAPFLDDSGGTAPGVDWTPLFQAASLDPGGFTPTEPVLHPPLASDDKAAWKGEVDWLPGEPVRVEAAAYGGAPVFFRVFMPWMDPQIQAAAARRITPRTLLGIMLMFAMAVAGFLAYRNLAAGRADRRGGGKLFIWITVGHIIAWLILADHVLDVRLEWFMIQRHVGATLFVAGVTWLFYIVLEPFVRRRSPESLISWNRITAGRLRDPRIGRDLLIGLAVGSTWTGIGFLGARAGHWLGGGPEHLPVFSQASTLLGARRLVGFVVDTAIHTVLGVMAMVFIITMFRVLLRRDWLAGPVFVVLLGLLFAQTTEAPLVHLPWLCLIMALVFFLARRYGLVALVAALYYDDTIRLGPVAEDLTSWVGGAELFLGLVVAAVAVWAFRISLGGRPALGSTPAA